MGNDWDQDWGGSAFPTQTQISYTKTHPRDEDTGEVVTDYRLCREEDGAGDLGMSLLDYFAGGALKGMLSLWESFEAVASDEECRVAAETAYKFGRAMLAERSKQT